MNKTEHYQLNQWNPEDPIRRTDFNEDNAKIDTALGNLLNSQIRLVTGSYKGTGTYGADHPNVLEIGDAERPPRVIVVSEVRGPNKVILLRGVTQYCVYISSIASHYIEVAWTDKGVSWYGNDPLYQFNVSAQSYCYAAFI